MIAWPRTFYLASPSGPSQGGLSQSPIPPIPRAAQEKILSLPLSYFYLLCQPEPKIQASLYLLFLPESVRYPTVPGKIYRHGSARGRKGRGRVLPYKLVAARWRRVAGRRIACQCWLRLPLEWLRRFIDASDACAGGLSCGSRLGAFGCQGCSRARGTLLTENKGRSTAFG